MAKVDKWAWQRSATGISREMDRTVKQAITVRCLGCANRGLRLILLLTRKLESLYWKIENWRRRVQARIAPLNNNDIFGPLGDNAPSEKWDGHVALSMGKDGYLEDVNV